MIQKLQAFPLWSLGSVFPNGTIRQLCCQLPSELFPVKEMILRHTLFPFYMRCQTLSAKNEMLGRLCRGEMATITSVRKFAERDTWRPRYCPRCAAEEQRRLGEAYWHVDHQIPLMTHCPTHGCRLISVEDLPMGQMDYTFFHSPLLTLPRRPRSRKMIQSGSLPSHRSCMIIGLFRMRPVPQKAIVISLSPCPT